MANNNKNLLPKSESMDLSKTKNSSNFLPNYYRTDTNKKFLHATINQLTQPGTVKKVNGYIGRITAKATASEDIFVEAPTRNRQNYQLEPSLTINDDLENTVFFKDYMDYINQLRVYGSNTTNHSRLNKQEMYSWDPHIDWDKFVNFQDYYWLPNGPDVVTIYRKDTNVQHEFSIEIESEGNANAYIVSPNILDRNPTITLYRGYTYKFIINSPYNPFSFKTTPASGGINRYISPALVTKLSNVIITSTSGKFSCSKSQILSVGDFVTVNGISTISNTILNHSSVSTYKISETNGSTIFSLVNLDNSPIVTLVGETDGLSFSAAGHSIVSGELIFTVPYTAPDILYYTSETDINLGGTISILDITESGYIDVNVDIIGKKTYQLPDGQPLSNGMCVSFKGNITPAKYSKGKFYVEGVGSSIQLIDEHFLEIVSPYVTSESVLFDATLFDKMPFSDATGYAKELDYIVINRGSLDKNPWSRYNRWFHKSVIEASAAYNGVSAFIDQSARAVRPIIEFEKDLKLASFGTFVTIDVEVIDQFTSDAFSIVEGSLGYTVDDISLKHGDRIIFTADTDITVANNIYRVEFIDVKHTTDGLGISNSRQIHLVLEETPIFNQVVLVKNGKISKGKMYWFNGLKWILAQQKTTTNQPPLFDIVDENGISFSDSLEYPGTTFNGTSLFSYKIGNGANDSKLGFPLSYKNINNIGDIVFNFSLVTDTFEYEKSNNTVSKSIDVGYLVITKNNESIYVNGWQICNIDNLQPAIRVYRNENKTNNFDIDLFDNLPNITDIKVRVYVNQERISTDKWYIRSSYVDSQNQLKNLHYHQVVFINDLLITDVVTIKVYSKMPINTNGYYEVPINLQNNPLNGTLIEFTLGEVIDHVDSIVDNIFFNNTKQIFNGKFPGVSNLRDLGNVTQYGTQFVQHSGPISLSSYHITSTKNNIISAIEKSRDDYCKFKRAFLVVADSLGIHANPIEHVNIILREMNKDVPATSAYYFSDMAAFGAYVKTDFVVRDPEIKYFSLAESFSMSTLSNKSILIYLNDNQLLHEKDYVFDIQGFVTLNVMLEVNDVVVIYEYENTDGCLIPETPTKLGIWPKYEPKLYLDTTLVNPVLVIQGHDGSLTKAYYDYRDELILELERRIFNNIKVKYDPNIFDIDDIIPQYNRITDYTIDEFNSVLAANFYQWSSHVKQDFSTLLTQDKTNSFLFNYTNHYAPDNRKTPGFWRGIYQWVYGTDRPHICPWEMLGFRQEPIWWIDVYGPAPYTSDNLVMWTDISQGLVKEPNALPIVLEKYIRTFLLQYLPVNSDGQLVSPLYSNVASGVVTQAVQGDFTFGDISPVEAAWRRNSHYPFSVLKTAILLNPAKTIGSVIDRSRIVRNLTNQLVYLDTGVRIKLSDIKLPSVFLVSDRVQTAGLINYLVNNIDCTDLTFYNQYKSNLSNLKINLSYRVSAFTSKEKFKLMLDSKSPAAVGNIFIPQEDYKVVLNTSSPVGVLVYSGVIITKIQDGFEIKGYSKTQPYFTAFLTGAVSSKINIGGISSSYSIWSPNQYYLLGSIVKYNNYFYQTLQSHTSENIFNTDNYTLLTALPISGGIVVEFKHSLDEEVIIPYGTKLYSIQAVVDFLIGYGAWLSTQGFNFNEFDSNLEVVANWESSAKQFVFWSAHNWGVDTSIWEDWQPDVLYQFGSIVRYNGDYYKALTTTHDSFFNSNHYLMLSGLPIEGNSVISLSPAADKLIFNTVLSVVDDISNPNYMYEFFDSGGNPIPNQFINSYRSDAGVTYQSKTGNKIFCATFYLVQKEHVIIINNETMFNDTVYNPESGYKQDKIKVSGYVSTEWNGSLNAPGFIFDQAIVNTWQPWKDYSIGDIVKHRTFYYSARKLIQGKSDFVDSDWIMMSKKPVSALLPNWNYKATQFTDFYSLDSDNFDITQQKMAQHLIGYQKRQYLENIIQDDVSEFKFYQGMIIEKGTQNVLNKLFDVLSADGQESLEFYEEWAIRSGQYGACNAFNTIEFVLDESLFKSNPQGFELVMRNLSTTDDYIIRQMPTDIYVKPTNYNINIWPQASDKIPLLRSAGHSRNDDVSVIIKTLSEITNISPKDLPVYGYVLCTFEGISWNVYQLVPCNLQIFSIDINDTGVTFTTLTPVPFSAESYIKINDDVNFSKFFKVVSVTTFTFIVDLAGFDTDLKYVPKTMLINVFKSRRIDTIDEINYTLSEMKGTSLAWSDNFNSTDKMHITWKHSPAYNQTHLYNQQLQPNLKFGRVIATTLNGNVVVTTTANGEIMIYDRASSAKSWVLRQVINVTIDSVVISDRSIVATTISISNNGLWLVVGSPDVSYVRSNDSVGVSLIPAIKTGSNLGYAHQGVITLYKKIGSMYVLVDTYVSPNQHANEYFGTFIEFSNDSFYVGNRAGHIYEFVYRKTLISTVLYNPNGSADTTLVVSDTSLITPGLLIEGIGFTDSQTVISVIDTTTITISGSSTDTPSGFLSFKTLMWEYNSQENFELGYNVKLTTDGNTIVIANHLIENDNGTKGCIYVYKKDVNEIFSLQEYSNIKAENVSTRIVMENFGQSISISDNAEYIAVSAQLNTYTATTRRLLTSTGIIIIYRLIFDTYVEYQRISDTNNIDSNAMFGKTIQFTNNFSTLVSYSENADSIKEMKFDLGLTSFDQVETDGIETTTFNYVVVDCGAVDVYQKYLEKWVLSERLLTLASTQEGTEIQIKATSNSVLIGSPFSFDDNIQSGVIWDYVKKPGQYSWNVVNKSISKPDVTKIKQAFLYNRKTNKLISYLDVVDPIQGKNPIIADREIKFKSFYDPAIYSYSYKDPITGNQTVSVNEDSGIAWSVNQLGTLWWDLRTAKFIDSYTDDIVYRNSTWSTLANGASIDIYEWVQTDLLPSEWDIEADTESGLANGISGLSLYGDNAYCINEQYDAVSQQFYNTYYFWVKNKITIPNIPGRRKSAYEVASLISNPRGSGYEYLALTGLNSFSLVNIKQLLQHDDVVLSVEFWTGDKTDQNIHSQWKLLSTASRNAIPALIEQKWVDSLCGYDIQNREVPDQKLPVKLKYGIENRPRQSMFVNRFEAIKQLVEQVNLILKENLIVDTRNLSKFHMYDEMPNVVRGLYDDVLDTDAELRFAIAKSFIAPVLYPVIVDGRITNVTIVSSGRGYLQAPYITVKGSGTGALVKSIINGSGQIVGINVIRSGEGYNNSTLFEIRSYSLLIKSDSQSNNGWSIYAYNSANETWNKTLVQTYNVSKYWNYIDWYATGYNQFTAIDHSIETYSDLNLISVKIGETVKIRTINANRWVILEKYSNSSDYDWTSSYKIVGSQNGTISLSSLLYYFNNTTIGYDGFLFDLGVYDNSATYELRVILNALKDDILIDELKNEYLKLFFSSIRYLMTEQTYVDWIFKTSFVNVTHKVGNLRQLVTYKNDNLSNFEDYVSEVKPYRTQIREYVSLYNVVDNSNLLVSDFDMPPVYNKELSNVTPIIPMDVTIHNEQLYTSDTTINQYPWKSWLTNVGFSVVSIKILDGGSGYINEPTVVIFGKEGSGATAKAYISNGSVVRVKILTTGSKYLSIPIVSFVGGLVNDGVAASAIAIIGDSVVRSTLTKIKFDRITSTYVTTIMPHTETFIGTGSKLQFPLTWVPNITIGESVVTINGLTELRNNYKFGVNSIVTNYTKQHGYISFTTAPPKNAVIEVSYVIDGSMLNAADRIRYFYNPSSGNLGKDLSQLMAGIDYGGVIVSGANVTQSVGWNSNNFYTDNWDSFVTDLTDYKVAVSANTYEIQLPYVPVVGTMLNVYYYSNLSTEILTTNRKQVEYRFENNYDQVPTVQLYRSIPIVSDALLNTDILHLDSVKNIQVGDRVSELENSHWTTAIPVSAVLLDNGYNIISVAYTSILKQGMPIIFLGKEFGNLQASHTYYVRSIRSSTTITISNSINGAEVAVLPSTGAMKLIVGSFKFDTQIKSIDIAAKTITLTQPISTKILSQTLIKISRELTKYKDLSVLTRSKVVLRTSLPSNLYLEISGVLQPKRLDDVNYSNINYSSRTNKDCIMLPIIADGVSNIVNIPQTYIDFEGNRQTFVVNNGDTFIIRQSTSSGSPTMYDYDSAITGGTFAVGSAAGILPEDIIIDGDQLVNQEVHAGPEEIVPGQVIDTLAIKVYDKSAAGSYIQFKDMLNRTHFKRLNAAKQTILTTSVLATSTTITVENASHFDLPSPQTNKPGVIEINGERIEFFSITGNVLSQLRRGTLGTGVPNVHSQGSIVQEIGAGENIPISDELIIEHYESDGTNLINLSFSPKKSSTRWKTSITNAATYGQSDEIEVFIGGYNILEWNANTDYTINDIIKVDSYTYKCIESHTSTDFINDLVYWTFFVGNVRLKKSPYVMHNGNINMYSPAGDVNFDADFSVDGKTQQLRLTNILPIGTQVTVVRKVGNDWNHVSSGNLLKISSFLTDVEPSQYCVTIVSASRSGSIVTLIYNHTSTNQPIVDIGSLISIIGCTPSAYNGTFTVISSSSTSVSFTITGTPSRMTTMGYFKIA